MAINQTATFNPINLSMPTPTIITSALPQEFVNQVHDMVVRNQNDAIARHGDFNLAVSGGKVSKILASALLGQQDIQWEKIKIYFVDETLVPFDHTESNYGSLKREVLDKLSVQPQIYPIDESLIAQNAPALNVADRYAEDLDRSLQACPVFINPTAGITRIVPKLDLILLDYSDIIPSLFSNVQQATEDTNLAVTGFDRRICLTKSAFAAAEQIGVIALNSDKQPVLNEIMDNTDTSLQSLQLNSVARTSVVWLVKTGEISVY